MIFGPTGHRKRQGGFSRMGHEERAVVAGSRGPVRCGGAFAVARTGPLPSRCARPPLRLADPRHPFWGGGERDMTDNAMSRNTRHRLTRLLECALAARADYLVTGDKEHLLPLRSIGRTQIVTPAAFLELG